MVLVIIWRTLFCVRTLVDVLGKSWSAKFQKTHPNGTAMKPFFSQVTTCNFVEKKPHHSEFLMTFAKLFRISLDHWQCLIKSQRNWSNSKLFWTEVEIVLEKKLIRKPWSHFSLSHNLQLYWKRNLSQLFSDDICKTFEDTFLCHNTGKFLYLP